MLIKKKFLNSATKNTEALQNLLTAKLSAQIIYFSINPIRREKSCCMASNLCFDLPYGLLIVRNRIRMIDSSSKKYTGHQATCICSPKTES